MCHAHRVPPKDLAAATAEYRAAQQALDEDKARVQAGQERLRAARADLTEAVVAAAQRGERMRDLVAATGLSREWLRTLLRQNGVYPDD